jgi:hypothetical protein
MSFSLIAGTSKVFSFSPGVMQINLVASDPNNPGTTTLIDVTDGITVLWTCNTSFTPDIPGFGTIWQQVAAQGQSFILSCTADQQVSIYFDGNPQA